MLIKKGHRSTTVVVGRVLVAENWLQRFNSSVYQCSQKLNNASLLTIENARRNNVECENATMTRGKGDSTSNRSDREDLMPKFSTELLTYRPFIAFITFIGMA